MAYLGYFQPYNSVIIYKNKQWSNKLKEFMWVKEEIRIFLFACITFYVRLTCLQIVYGSW